LCRQVETLLALWQSARHNFASKLEICHEAHGISYV
jgi:hypothetical protein